MELLKSKKSKDKAFQLKGSLFTLSVLELHKIDLDAFRQELDDLIKQAPKFFEATPIVLNLKALNGLAVDIDFNSLIDVMRERDLIPVGVRGGSPEQHASAKLSGLAVLSSSKHLSESERAEKNNSKEEENQIKPASGKIITKPVRSGQQIYAPGGDLIIMAPVSQGAECLADGSIHIYGPLRGRALAGISGDTNARIFCRSMEAELVSIAGRYIANESLLEHPKNADTQIYLKNDKLHFELF